MAGNARREAVARVMPQKPNGTIQMTPDDDGRWRNGQTREQAFGMETTRHQQMSDLIVALKGESKKKLNIKLFAATSPEEKNRAAQEHGEEGLAIQKAKVEEDRAHMDNKDAIGRYWDVRDPRPNRIDGRDNKRYTDKVLRPNLAPYPPPLKVAPNPSRRFIGGRIHELRNGKWVPV